MNVIAIPVGILTHSPDLGGLILSLIKTLSGFYVLFFFLGTITTITEWKSIHCTTKQKVKYLFTFPLFMLTYIPISVIALFCKVEWKPIQHSVAVTLEDICDKRGISAR
jgi:hypothetical protein